MLQQALQKIQAEIAGSKKTYVPVIGGFVMDHIRKNPQDAALVLAEGKTIEGSIKAMETEARKPEYGGMLSDQDGFNVVLKYFGVHIPETVPASAPAATFDVSLDDLL